MSEPPLALTAHYRWMARYNTWINARLLEAAASLSDAERKRDRGAFFGSIHGTFNHLVVGDKLWLGRFAGLGPGFEMLDEEVLSLPPFTGLDMQVFEDFDVMVRHRQRMDAAIEAFAAQLTPELVSASFAYTTSKGLARRHPCWQALSHFFNHQTHHRGQITTLLMQAGVDPGMTDLLALVD
ncbi:DinB family protein [Aquabacterium sp. A7-Y]|uniref:DinB family protein n=1 Tax=Aquabacterium sp. A7-Y TaxID=1349605 RepID=UPI00223D2998|nr:DinB family protein [Aquabacterium sp. A7-Y]MCW7539159.1 DinB family protein [Aquabacterium sp. A7-Y]